MLAGNGGSPTAGGGALELESGSLGALGVGCLGEKERRGGGVLVGVDGHGDCGLKITNLNELKSGIHGVRFGEEDDAADVVCSGPALKNRQDPCV